MFDAPLRIFLDGQEVAPDEYVLHDDSITIHPSVLARRGLLPDPSRVYGDLADVAEAVPVAPASPAPTSTPGP